MRSCAGEIACSFGSTRKTDAAPFHALLRLIRILIDRFQQCPGFQCTTKLFYGVCTLRNIARAIPEIAKRFFQIAARAMVGSPHAARTEPLAF